MLTIPDGGVWYNHQHKKVDSGQHSGKIFCTQIRMTDITTMHSYSLLCMMMLTCDSPVPRVRYYNESTMLYERVNTPGTLLCCLSYKELIIFHSKTLKTLQKVCNVQWCRAIAL
uniref:Uncharacterized protein n=1 Tax=Eutreptiella gymnastica TaxID=73025 RepID=A0A7S1HXG2_9EUGL